MSDLVEMVLTAHLGSAWSALPLDGEMTLGEFVRRRAEMGESNQQVAELGWVGARYEPPEDCRVVLGRELRGLPILRRSLRMFALLGVPRPRMVIEEESPRVSYPSPRKFRIFWRGRQLLQEEVWPGEWLATGPCEEIEGRDPFWLSGKWIKGSQKRRAVKLGCKVFSCADAVSGAVEWYLKSVAWELLSLDEVDRRLKRLRNRELAQTFEVGQVHQLLIRCLKSGQRIGRLEQILAAAARAGSTIYGDWLRELGTDPLLSMAADEGRVPIWSLPPRLEEALLNNWAEPAANAIYSFVSRERWMVVECNPRLRPRLEVEFPKIRWILREEILDSTPVLWMGPLP
jgi:hypothetical protein